MIIVPKHLSSRELYTTSLFSLAFQLFIDSFLDFEHNLYGYFDHGLEFHSLLIVFGIYPAVNILFLNFYPYKKSLSRQILYIIVWSIFSLVYEWLSIKTNVFYYNKWSLWYSALCYPFIFAIYAFNLYMIRKILK